MIGLDALEMLDATTLNPWLLNPRRITDAQIAALRRSLLEYGLTQPIVVRREGLIVIGGHQRLRVAMEMEATLLEGPLVCRKRNRLHLGCVVLDIDERRAAALNVTLNKVTAEWDPEALARVLSEFGGENSPFTGFSTEESSAVLSLLTAPDAAIVALDAQLTEAARMLEKQAARLAELRLSFRLPNIAARDIVLSAVRVASATSDAEDGDALARICREWCAAQSR